MDYSRISRFYDLYADAEYDLGFWELVTRSAQGPVLELFCGTGRLVHYLRKCGYPVDGLDRSPGMLTQAREKCAGLSEQPLLHLAEGSTFSLGQRFSLIFVAFQGFEEVVDDEEKRAVLRQAAVHLADDGRFWITIHNPLLRRPLFDGSEYDLGDFELEEGGGRVAVRGSYQGDPETGIVNGEQHFLIEEGAETESLAVPVCFQLIEPDHLEALLVDAGFAILSRYGDYDFSVWNRERSRFLILECALQESR